jgi:hypothetical protein
VKNVSKPKYGFSTAQSDQTQSTAHLSLAPLTNPQVSEQNKETPMRTIASRKPWLGTPDENDTGTLLDGQERLERIRVLVEENERQKLTREKKRYLLGILFNLRRKLKKTGGSDANND